MIFNLTQPVLDSAPKFTYTGTYEYIDDGGGNWRIKFLTSGTFTPLKNMTADAFLVGGGAGGGYRYGPYGGGGGYTKTEKSIALSANNTYEIVIGAGGESNGNGGETSAFSVTVSGGSGKNGGSGGGTGSNVGRNGGSDGSDGYTDSINTAGKGQGTTTREFGEPTGTLYSGGGGGAGRSSSTCGLGGDGGGGDGTYNQSKGKDGEENSGGGGGGNYVDNSSGLTSAGGRGGSGIVIIRKHKEVA